MNTAGRIAAGLAGLVGVAAAGTTIGVIRQQRQISLRAGEEVPFGSLMGKPISVTADDGVQLHVEIDQLEQRPRRTRRATGAVTLVFVHGFCLDQHTWHFQRAAYRGLVRSVYFDQRSHGVSERAPRDSCTAEQLGQDLRAVIDAVDDGGPVVVVGHSMGGMSIMSFAEQYPELLGSKVVAAMLVATAADDLDPARMIVPVLPTRLTSRFTGPVTARAVDQLSRGSRHRLVDVARKFGSSIAIVATDTFAFGGQVPASYVEFTDRMLASTSFEVIADFYNLFNDLDLNEAASNLERIPTTIIAAEKDRITRTEHSVRLHELIEGSRLIECEGAGHMVVYERHDLVTAELDQLITRATSRRGAR